MRRERFSLDNTDYLSTPAKSAIIEKLNEDNDSNYCFRVVFFSACRNPGGPDQDFDINFNEIKRDLALKSVTDEIFEQTKKITQNTLHQNYLNIDTVKIGLNVWPIV
jgi:phosphoglucomutase